MSIESTPQTFFFVHDSYLTDEQQQKKTEGSNIHCRFISHERKGFCLVTKIVTCIQRKAEPNFNEFNLRRQICFRANTEAGKYFIEIVNNQRR